VRVFDVANDGDLHYLIMEFVRGEDAHQRVQRTGPLPLAEALGIVREACLGLGAAHREGIVHRDAKPANLLISSRGAVKVGDLGLAKPAHGSPDSMVSMAGVAVGTPAFMPPEQWAGTATSATDVWALGSTLFYLLTGTPAFAGDSVLTVMHQITTQPFPDLRQTIADAPDDLVALIEQATASDPAQRFADADAMAAAIDALSVAVGRVEPLNDADALATMSSLPSRAVLDELRAAVEAGEDATPAAEPAADAAGTPERDARNLGTLIKLAVVAVLASATVGAFGGLWVWETCDAGRVAAWQLLAPTMIAVVVFCAPLYVLRRRWFPTRERLQAAIAARTGANS
ncbi:MAG: serine/threonine protein kinase, partial [Planctomycetes bacterium]|nr:serine/threonine protein kinase [Planctomycetota bacterium]